MSATSHRFAIARMLAALPLTLAVVLSAAPVATPAAATSLAGSPNAADPARVSAQLASAPLLFVQNAGQWDSRARFQVQAGDATWWLADDGVMWVTVIGSLVIGRRQDEAGWHARSPDQQRQRTDDQRSKDR